MILTDAHEYGIEGYNPISGIEWHFRLPELLTASSHINILEFIASTIDIWLELINTETITPTPLTGFTWPTSTPEPKSFIISQREN